MCIHRCIASVLTLTTVIGVVALSFSPGYAGNPPKSSKVNVSPAVVGDSETETAAPVDVNSSLPEQEPTPVSDTEEVDEDMDVEEASPLPASEVEVPILPSVDDTAVLIPIGASKQIPWAERNPIDPWQGETLRPDQIEVAPVHLDTDRSYSPPANVYADHESMHMVTCTWDDSSGQATGYAFAVGTAPGWTNVKYWQSCSRNKAFFYPLKYNLQPGSTIYVSVRTNFADGSASSTVSSNAVTLHYDPMGDSANQINLVPASFGFGSDGVTPVPGWCSWQISRLNGFCGSMLPIIRELYGPPAQNRTVLIVRDLKCSNDAYFYPGYNEVHMGDEWYPQLLTHELIHTFRDNVMLTRNSYWEHDPTLTAFEEGFAQAVSYECMNLYIARHPGDPYVNTNEIWYSDNDWDYNFQNVPELATRDFWSDQEGMWLCWTRYQMAAAAMRKIQIEHPGFYQQFNQLWYQTINSNPTSGFYPSRALILNLINQLVPTVEGIHTIPWIDRQYVLACADRPGRKIWLRTQHNPSGSDYHIDQYIYNYETFPNGSDWAWLYGNQWFYYYLNGSTGFASLTDFAGNCIWWSSLLIEPIQNPPVYNNFGYDFKRPININSTQPDDIPGLHDLQLYTMHVAFPPKTPRTYVYRIVGDALANSHGIWGGIRDGRGGQIYVDHDGYPAEAPLPVVNGVFHGTRSWAGIYNSATGQYETVPGRVHLRYVNASGRVYQFHENIDRGSWQGNHIFLPQSQKPGDMDCDGKVTFADIDPFVWALSGQATYQAQYPDCNWFNGDINNDGITNFADIDGFVANLGL